MVTEFGPRLRRERERRLISLQSIAASTKVSVALFEGLERDDVSRWPGGIFRRSFVRAYAMAVGLDADAIVREFVERFPDPIEAVPPSADGPGSREHPAGSDRTEGLRVTLTDRNGPFTGGSLLPDVAGRSAAVALDAAVVVSVALMLSLIVGAFWFPLAAFTMCYYWGGILILGNTPGVCLKAPKRDPDR